MDDKVRLIDASAVCEKLREIIEEYERRIPDYSANDVLGNGKKAARKWGNKADGIEKAISVINAAPTIEASPVKRGSIERLTNAERYEMFYKSRKDFDGKCSECGAFVFDTDKLCSMCGAVFHNGERGNNNG